MVKERDLGSRPPFVEPPFGVGAAHRELAGHGWPVPQAEVTNPVKEYLDGPLVDSLMKNPVLSDIDVKVFDVLPELTKITKGPI